MGLFFVLEFCFKNFDNVVNSILLKVCFLYKHSTWSIQDSLCCVKANVLYSFNYPLFDFVCKLVKIDVVLLLSVDFTIYVDGLFCNHAGELDVQTVLTDSK